MDAKLNILTETFKSRFAQERFLRFVTEFFGGQKRISSNIENTNIPIEYRCTVELYTHIATYTTDGDTLDIFAVKLQSGKGCTGERARSMQRSFISKLLSNSNHDAAVVAFYTDDDSCWRLSFIRLDYEFAAWRVKMSLTPAKRYSYLVGENEPCHTAAAQLYPIFREDDYNPSLNRIEEAFSVERVTKDFFEQYKEKYFILKDHLDKSEVFNEEAARCGFTSELFAKKLMGQIAFLYFLQKKGWLGVRVLPPMLTEKEYESVCYSSRASRGIIMQVYQSTDTDEYKLNAKALVSLSDEDADIAAGCFKSDEWGKGDKAFVRHLFNACKTRNFFGEYLEPLFYEALNHKCGATNYYRRFNCKIPFLNGGLFEPLEGYCWSQKNFYIPNEIFSNISTKGESDADGILDIFDRYNFTLNEDEPFEQEVAVDPEMLGKVFENLLDEKSRKSKGAFYTPREIVHYMCTESLVNYLVGKTGVPYDDMKAFIVDGEFMKDEDYSNRGERRLPQTVFDKLSEIDRALETIRVADPAVGSGAFPLGMLSEIVKARNNITYYNAAMLATAEERTRIFERREPYNLKWQTIQNCIFAVDIEASAVDIAKLRLWLSLVVDEELSPSFDELRLGDTKQKDPRPLPNLDCNIMCGDSLIDEFEGIQLFDDTLHKKAKHEIKQNIDKIIDNIIRTKLERDKNDDGLRKYEESIKQKTKPYFLWRLEFSRVFRENGGFDIVIGNPPYVQLSKEKNIDDKYKEFLRNRFGTSGGRLNLFIFMTHLGCELLNDNGTLAFIIPNTVLTQDYYKKTRELLVKKSIIRAIVDYQDMPFDNAVVENTTLIFSKGVKNDYSVKILKGTKRAVEYLRDINIEQFRNAKNYSFNINSSSFIDSLFEGSTPLSALCNINQAIALKGDKSLSVKSSYSNGYYKLLDGRNISKYGIKWDGNFLEYDLKRIHSCKRKDIFECSEKLLFRRVSKDLIFTYDNEQYYALNTLVVVTAKASNLNLKYLVGLLNSTLINFIYKNKFKSTKVVFSEIQARSVGELPIKTMDMSKTNEFIFLVNKALAEKQKDYNADISAFEAEIDNMVYELYGLTDDEIKIVEESVK